MTEEVDMEKAVRVAPAHGEFDIAVVGMACRFPGACNTEEFWENLSAGIESITRFTDETMLRAGVPRSFLENPRYVKAAPILEKPGCFDAAFFGLSPAEARGMDPQHRLLLELAYEALENAGCDADRYPGRIGVFTGAAMNTYFMNAALSSKFAEDYIPTLIANDKDFLSTRVSYKLNLKGPSITVQTACSTSLVAIHLARQSLLSEETDMALAGAVSVRVPHEAGYFCDGGGIVSPDGRVRAFDAKANGTVFGSGGGVIVLKRLADAIADGDAIHAVIKGSAVNNDGSEKAGYTAPSVNSQSDAVVEALTVADVNADSITYVEAHGSGTPIGDPIEMMALTKAFRAFTQRSGYCAIGSVKANVGHLDAAAGMAGFIKTVLALKHRKLPPSLNYTEPNPEIDFAATPFYVNTQLVPWAGTGLRRAGVMSTGMGGTNAHVILEEAGARDEAVPSALPHLLVISAKTSDALDAATGQLREFLENNTDPAMDDVAYTLQTGRKHFAHRKIVVCKDRKNAVSALSQEKAGKVNSGYLTDSTRRPVIFLLPGVGDHYVGMGRELYEKSEIFRQEVDRCAEVLEPFLNVDIRNILYREDPHEKRDHGTKGIDLKKMLGQPGDKLPDPAAQELNRTVYAQPALFTIEYALASLWKHLGITPDAIVGHSMGEYVAACLAGVITLEDALRLVAQRATRANDLPQGAMLAVLLSEAEIRPLLPQQLSIALINSPSLCVVAGPALAVAEFEGTLNAKGIINRRVQNAHAFHSRMLDPIAAVFADDVRKVRLREPKIPFISNVTGTWITKAEATDPKYWAKHLTETARFSDALKQMSQFKNAVLLEIGPGKTLGVLAAQHPARKNAGNVVTVSSLRHHYENQSDVEFLYHSIGKLWLSGIEVDWEKLPQAKQRRKIPLPTYPFERQNYWIEAKQVEQGTKESPIHKNVDLSRWFYVPSWKRTLPKFGGVEELSAKRKQNWLVFSDDSSISSELVDLLKACGHKVVTVREGRVFQQSDDDNFILNASKSEDYDTLCRTLQASGGVPEEVVHAWSLKNPDSGNNSFQRAQDLGFYSLSFLVRALAKHNIRNDLNLFVLSSQIQEVHGRERLSPEKSTLLGPCMIIPQEYPNIRIKNIDLELRDEPETSQLTIDQIAGEFLCSDLELFVAHRNGQRWVQLYEPIEVDGSERRDRSIFRERGTYLITGGLGNIGFEIAKYLAKAYRAKLALIGRSHLPKRELWDTWIANQAANDVIVEKIGKIKEIERLGGEVLYLEANVEDLDGMRRVIDQATKGLGEIHGVIHGAGTTGNRSHCELKDVDPDRCEMHFKAKAHGLRVLETVLDNKPVDFCLLLSSLSSILGGIGQAAYAASNVYMDAFVRSRTHSRRTRWLSVNWDVWRVRGDAWGAPGLGKTLAELGMTGEEALKVMEIALSFKNADQLVVSTGDLDARIRQWIKLESVAKDRLSERTKATQFEASEDGLGSGESEIESKVTRIWQEVLGVNPIGLEDNFSDLGGHSLLAIKIVAALRKAFAIEVPIRALFDAPTIAELSAYIRKQRDDVEQTRPVDSVVTHPQFSFNLNDVLEQSGKGNPKLAIEDEFVVPQWFVQQKTWIENPSGSDSVAYNYPLLLRIRGRLNQAALQRALQEIVQRHQALRSVFRVSEGEMVQVVVPAQTQVLPVTDLTGFPEQEREVRCFEIAGEKANRSFDLSREPSFRSELFRLGVDHHVLQLTTHHIVHDDWSSAILLSELSECYQAFDTGKKPELADITFQYSDFVRWHQEQLCGERLNARLSYWRQQFADGTGFRHLTTDFPSPAISSHRGARERAVLPADLARALQELGRRERVSLFMILLAGFQCLLHRQSNDTEIGIGTCAANRALPEVEKLVGHFGNDMLLRTSLAGNPTVRELVSRVREATLNAYSNQDLPFGRLLREISINAEQNQNAAFQTMFILQNARRENREVPGLKIDWLPLDTGTAKHDLIVWVKEEPLLEITLEYKSDLFRPATIRQLIDNYRTILETVAVDPERRIDAISFLKSRDTTRRHERPVAARQLVPISNSSAPVDDVEKRLVDLWEKAFKVGPIGVNENFFELGGDSLLAARLFAQMEKNFQVDLPLATLLEAPTVSRLARIISNRSSRLLGSSLIPIQSSGTKPPLFCVHGHMGEVFYCRNLSSALGADQPLYGLRSQGLGGESPHRTVEQMASHYLKEIRRVQPQGPYLLSGFCLGGMVAFEMAKLLKAQGEEVALLVLFNAPAPGGLEGWPLNRIYLTKRVAHELGKLRERPMGQKVAVIAAKSVAFTKLAAGVVRTGLWRRLRARYIHGEKTGAQRLLRVADINVAAAKTYYPTAYPGRVTFFLTEEVVSLYATDPTEGWSKLAQHGIEVHDVEGDNNSMFDARFVGTLAQKLRSCIDRASREAAFHGNSAGDDVPQPKDRKVTFCASTAAAPT